MIGLDLVWGSLNVTGQFWGSVEHSVSQMLADRGRFRSLNVLLNMTAGDCAASQSEAMSENRC